MITTHINPDLSPTVVIALIAVGVVFGLISTLVGGGSIISLPALLYLGVSPHAANATNRVVGVTQTVSAAINFWRRGAVDTSSIKSLCGYASLGGVLGALISLRLNPSELRSGIHVCLLLIALFTLFAPRRLFVDPPPRGRGVLAQRLGATLVGIYGGFIQAGIGLVTLYYVRFVCGYDLVRGNAFKTALILMMVTPAFCVFIYSGEIKWDIGICLAAGGVIGSRLGVSLSLAPSGARWIRVALPCVALLMVLNLIMRSLTHS